MKKKRGNNSALKRDDRAYVKFEQLLAKAENEGRIDGQSKCLICGMRYLHSDEAYKCCRIGDDSREISAPVPILLGSCQDGNKKTRLPHGAKTYTAFMVSLEALDIEFDLDQQMLTALNTVNFGGLLPGETIECSSETNRELLIILFSVLLDRADGLTAKAFQIARAAGMELDMIQWGKITKQLKELGVLVPMLLDHDDPEDENDDDSPDNEEAGDDLAEEVDSDSEDELPNDDLDDVDWDDEPPDETEDEIELEE
ncbi:CDP-alcohol phosphatidyltransferase family protein [Patescibacteria group bacterium]|nr:CDP-alcohol phosphatidyltransferase family protein [Patescibacteria group bacterium]